jgi:uncharacterized protein
VSQPLEENTAPITELSKGQRRVLGTLLEKAYTTPEGYPLTLKSLTAGCNQKSNRHPMTDYSEDDVLEFLDQLREMGLVAVVHTESGRTERYRHYMRKRFTLSEPQLAVLTELLLRGRQSVGDLRARASRMVAIESLDDLREALRGLASQNYLQASGSLDRRGVEVDHNFYQAGENKRIAPGGTDTALDDESVTDYPSAVTASQAPRSVPNAFVGSPVSTDQAELQNRVAALESEVHRLKGIVDDLLRDLRG